MNYGEFMAAFRQHGLKHVYLLAGEENYYIEKAENKLLNQLFPKGKSEMQDALQKLDGDIDLDGLIGMMESAPFFADKNVVLVKNTRLFKESKTSAKKAGTAKKGRSYAEKQMERLLAVLADMPDYSYVIFETFEKADKRRKLYKAVLAAGSVLDAEPVRAWNIGEWLQDKLREMGKELDGEAYTYFMGAVGMMQQISLGYLDKQFEKLALYTEARRITKAELLQVFSSIPEVSGFSMLDAISAHDMKKALTLLARQIGDGVYPVLLLGLLVRHVRQLWQAKLLMARGIRGRKLGGPMELNPFIAEKIGRASQTFEEKQLEQALLDLADADYYLKTGQAGTEVLENVVIRLCKKCRG